MREFLSAVRSMLFARLKPRPVRSVAAPAPLLPERRQSDRRVVNLGSPAGFERRSGHDRRVAELALSAILAPRPTPSEYQIAS